MATAGKLNKQRSNKALLLCVWGILALAAVFMGSRHALQSDWNYVFDYSALAMIFVFLVLGVGFRERVAITRICALATCAVLLSVIVRHSYLSEWASAANKLLILLVIGSRALFVGPVNAMNE